MSHNHTQTVSITGSIPEPQAYYPTLQDIDSTYSDSVSLCSDPVLFPRMLSPHIRSRSLIHDVSDTEALANNELNHYQDELQNALQHEIKDHRHNSANPLPNLSSMKSLKLQLDTKIKAFRKPFLSPTPTLKNKETKQLCEKLDNINILINELNQYIKNHKAKQIKNDEFIVEKLTEIQDVIEDSEIYIEEHLDQKFIKLANEQNILRMNTERERTQNANLKKEVNNLQERIQTLEREKLQIVLLRKQQTETSIVSHLSSLSQINEAEYDQKEREKDLEGKERKLSQLTIGCNHVQNNINEMKQKWDLEYKHKEMQMKRDIYKLHYQQMNAFITKICKPQYRLSRQLIDVVTETQSKLIANNTQFGVAMDKEERNVMNQRLMLIGNDPMHENDTNDTNDEDFNAVYKEQYIQHKQVIKERMDELRGLNMKSLQLQLDIMDVLNQKNDKKKHCSYDVFLERFMHSISKIFLDAKVILTNIQNASTCTKNDFCEKDNYNDDERGYMPPEIYHIVNKIPLTLKIIQLTDILSHSSVLLSLDEFKSYVQNIENFRLLLVENGMNEVQFIEKLAIQLIHCGIIKKKGKKKYRNQIKLITNLCLSIIARNLVAFEDDIDSFIDLIVLIVKYPPVLDQINISSRVKKKHKNNLKHILNETISDSGAAASTKQIDIRDTIKTYYNLYSNRVLIKNLKKFEKYMRHSHRGDDDSGCASADLSSSSSSSSSCSSHDSSSSCLSSASGDDSADDYYYENIHKQKQQKQKEQKEKSFMNVFNQLFVKCID